VEKKAPTPRKKAAPKMTDARALYLKSFGDKDQATPEVVAVPAPVFDVTAAVERMREAIAGLEIPLPAEPGSIRLGMRGTDPVLETNYGEVLGRFKEKDDAIATLNATNAERNSVAA
jgi:hypothetical protein